MERLPIKQIQRPVIDERHPGVQELLETGFPKDECLEALEHCHGDVQEAMQFLEAKILVKTREEEGDQSQSEQFPSSISIVDPMHKWYAEVSCLI